MLTITNRDDITWIVSLLGKGDENMSLFTSPTCTTYSVAEVAALLHRSEQTIQMWARQNYLHGFKVGRYWLFDSSYIDSIVTGKTELEGRPWPKK